MGFDAADFIAATPCSGGLSIISFIWQLAIVLQAWRATPAEVHVPRERSNAFLGSGGPVGAQLSYDGVAQCVLYANQRRAPRQIVSGAAGAGPALNRQPSSRPASRANGA
jgi:hypothetical protein